MRFVRTIAGMLLLTMGIPALLAGGGLWTVARHAEPDGGFAARLETARTPGQAIVVTDVDGLLRAEAPFVRTGQARLRLTARTADGPAFLGLAPSDQVRRWLDPVPHATVGRVALARGPLPVRLDPAGPAAAGTVAAAPLDQDFWVREGIGALEWGPGELAGRSLSLVVMRPDGRADLALEVRAELRAGWFPGAMWGLLAGGILLVVLAVALLLRPVRPREVVFVVEPDQVPVLAGRLGVTSLSGLGAQKTAEGRPPLADRQLVSVGPAHAGRSRAAIGPVPARRPETLADSPASPGMTTTWSWPPATEQTERPVPADRPGRPAPPKAPGAAG
ncbi:hypothetical protein EV384_2196 [Micromonospora kangleipakensis]|uniref:Uncharacterized protein n=1 Tax=Micromonospora kangleipakensis TaxID=1077942 RepID=A0A4Q8B9F8_9ACTN|nr:hypothetical protein [Micromonospora kangleipakensis]RZU73775.1 hypothetical protein EV384_2196 [Micromonospora kangleipakensis]